MFVVVSKITQRIMIFGNTEENVILVLNFGWEAERREDMGDD